VSLLEICILPLKERMGVHEDFGVPEVADVGLPSIPHFMEAQGDL